MFEIPVGRFGFSKMLVSPSDYLALRRFSWWRRKQNGKMYSASRDKNGKSVIAARLITRAPPNYDVDHINGNTLDNRRENLRIVTKQQNQWNRFVVNSRSGYKGVTRNRHKKSNQFVAQIKKDYVRHHLGYYATPEAAAWVYDQAASALFREYARLNGVSRPRILRNPGRATTGDGFGELRVLIGSKFWVVNKIAK